LGVQATGGGGGGQIINNFNTTIEASPGASEQDTDKMFRQWRDKQEAWVKTTLVNQQRTRGILNPGQLAG